MSARDKLRTILERCMVDLLEEMGREDRMGPMPAAARESVRESASKLVDMIPIRDAEALVFLSEEDLFEVMREEFRPIARAACASMRAS